MIPLRHHHFDTVDSTNDIALQMAQNGEPEGTIITAGQQLKGRGRRGRAWFDKPNQSVLMSIIVKPDIPPTRLHELSFIASLSAAQCLKVECGLDISLKWPNDVYIGNKKLGGILIEAIPAANPSIAIIGMGINVNQRTFPPELSGIATSVVMEHGFNPNTEELTQSLAKAILSNYEAYLLHGFEEILSRWSKYMWGIGRQARITTEGQVLQGVISGVDSSGALLLEDPFGNVQTVHAIEAMHLDIGG